MIELKNIFVRNGSYELNDISFKINPGDYAVLAGNSGTGKSTLLETIVGLRQARKGDILVNGHSISSRMPSQRGIGYVPQDVCLFPKMDVESQIAFSLEVRTVKANARLARVKELLSLLELNELKHRLPTELSGGQRQRVAIGRALAFQPNLICLDEPLSAIDIQQRASLVSLLKTIHETWSTTVLHVTHQVNDLKPINFSLLELVDGKVHSRD